MKHLLLYISLFILLNLNSQTYDRELWTSVSLSKKIAKGTKADVKIAFRSTNIINDYSYFSQLSINKNLPGDWKTKLSYRYARGISYDDQFSEKNRLSLDLSNKWKIFKIRCQFRMRFQYGTKNRSSDKWGSLYSGVWRNRMQFSKKYNKKIHYFTAFESFHFNDGNWFSGYRLGGGLLLDAGKRKELKISYIYEQGQDSPYKSQSHILNIGYSYSLK